jgi:glycosyltransferase involved in cell wall biosynthesis
MTRRVAILCEFPTLNGGERSLLAALPHVIQSGWSPVALCPGHGPLADSFQSLGIPVAPFETRNEQGQSRNRSEQRTMLREQLSRIAPQLVHANSLSMGRLSGPVVAELGIPSIAHLRDILSLSRPAIADLNHHTRLLAVSAATQTAHVAQGVDESKTHVLHNGVDLTAFAPRPADGWLRRELGLPDSALFIGCIGQFILRKGQDVLAAAAAQLAERFPHVHFVFLGARHSEKAETRRFEADLLSKFAATPLSGRGHFLGTRDDVPRILPELTLLAHPARQEPLGRVLLEAAAAGCPIVATAVGGTPEIFPPDAQAALLVPPDSPIELAAAIERLLLDAELRATLGANARRRAEQAFDAQASAARLVEHYNEVTNT